MNNNNDQPLSGVKVIDLTTVISGPYITQILGDMGAEIIKIETPAGDLTRSLGETISDDLTIQFCMYNRNKKSVCLDLKSKEGYEVFTKLVQAADVVVENFRAGVVESLRASYEDLRKLNSKIICASVRGFPEGSDLENVRCYDSMIQALGGFSYIQGDEKNPQFIQNPIADKIAGQTCLTGLLAALYSREKTNTGQRVVVSMLGSYFSFMRNQEDSAFMCPDFKSTLPKPRVHECFPIKDGWASFMFLKIEQFRDLFSSLGKLEMFQTKFENRDFFSIYNDLINTCGKLIAELDCDQLSDLAIQTKLPIAPVLNRTQSIKYAERIKCSLTTKRNDLRNGLGYYDINSAIHFSNSKTQNYSQPPALGEHTVSVLKGLDYSDEEIKKILDKGTTKSG